MWSDLRAEAVLRELRAMGAAGLEVNELHAQSLSSVGRVVPFDAACVGAVDPDTLLLTSGVTIGFAPGAAESQRFAEIEYGGVERFSFANLIDRRSQWSPTPETGARCGVRTSGTTSWSSSSASRTTSA